MWKTLNQVQGDLIKNNRHAELVSASPPLKTTQKVGILKRVQNDILFIFC